MYRMESDLWGTRSQAIERNDQENEAKQEEADDSRLVPYLFGSLYATILEDTLVQLRILSECNTFLKLDKTMIDMRRLLTDKFGVAKPEVTDELAEINPHQLYCEEYKINKLEADRTQLSKVFEFTYMDLSLDRTYVSLQEKVKSIIDLEAYRNYLRQEETKNKALKRDLNKQLRQQRNHYKTVAYEYETMVEDLRRRVEDAELMAATENRYVENWQRARTEQHELTIHNKEYPNLECIEKCKVKYDHEQRVHNEVETLVNIAITETLEKVEQWMEKYDKDMEAIDLRIQIQKNDYQNILSKREYLEKTIDEHEKLMKDWIHFKEEREKARQYAEKMTKSAIMVQAWWRGLLVRLQLGPYKVSKKKGKKKKPTD